MHSASASTSYLGGAPAADRPIPMASSRIETLRRLCSFLEDEANKAERIANTVVGSEGPSTGGKSDRAENKPPRPVPNGLLETIEHITDETALHIQRLRTALDRVGNAVCD